MHTLQLIYWSHIYCKKQLTWTVMLSNTLKQENAHIILNVKLGHVLLNEENSPDVTRIKTAGWFAHLAMVDGKLNEFTHPKI